MSKTKLIWALSILTMALAGCSNESSPYEPPQNDDPVSPIVIDDDGMSVDNALHSTHGCLIDHDCAEGAFCFESQCVVQCNDELSCNEGYACQIARGRCIREDYLQNLATAIQNLDNNSTDMPPEEVALAKAVLDLEAEEHSEISQAQNEKKALAISDFISRIPAGITLDPQNNKQQVSFRLRSDYGVIYYAVKTDDNKLPILKRANSVKTVDGDYEYTFEIDAAELQIQKTSLLRDNKETSSNTDVNIVSSIGNSNLLVLDAPELNGIYTGHVVPKEVLSGIDLPIRMGIKVNPEDARSFDDIKSMTLMLPASNADVFSPENVALDNNGKVKETWASVEIAQKDDAASCRSGMPCFAAVFSTNDYAPANSLLLDEDRHVNRNIRIEITGMDATDHKLTGQIIDRLDGIYREVTDRENPSDEMNYRWNSTEMHGLLSAKLSNEIDMEKMSVHSHSPAAEKIRDIAEEPDLNCTDAQVGELMSLIVSPYKVACNTLTDENDIALCNQYVECTGINSIATWENASDEYKYFCLNKAIEAIQADESRVSAVLKNVLISDASSAEIKDLKVCDKNVSNFEDFRTLCADTTCDLCKPHPEYTCAADLLSLLYRNDKSLNTEDKTAIAQNWVSMMNEANLSEQYLAWNQDIEIRKSWLTGAVYENTFAENVMSTFNTGLLNRYRSEVLDVHHTILQTLTHQNILEMLSISNEDAKDNGITELSSARNEILNQIATSWTNLSDSLGLMARRYDVLSQDDMERVTIGSELRAYLFDLYYVGLVASHLNLKADQGSLNGSFGANLASIMEKLESLDQPFEDLVFMRDGEIFTDTRLEDGSDTALGRLKTTAKTAVEKAVSKRTEVFNAIEKKNAERISAKDSYLSSLESMRTKLVDLCGYPADCKTAKQRENCQIFTAPYFCGFALDSLETEGVDLSEIAKADTAQTISSVKQIDNYYDCILKNSKLDQDGKIEASNVTEETYEKCLGAGIGNETIPVSYNGSNISKAGQAIENFRIANRNYDSAVAEYNIYRQKIQNTNETLNAYAKSLSNRYDAMMKTFDNISSTLDTIKKYEKALEAYNIKVENANIDGLYAEYQAQKDNFDNWMKIAGTSQILPDISTIINGALQSYILINQLRTGGITFESLEQVGMKNIIMALYERNVTFYAEHYQEFMVAGGGAASFFFNDFSTNTDIIPTNAILEINANYMLNEKYTALANLMNTINSQVQTQFNFQIERLQRENKVDAAKAKAELAETLAGIKSAVKLHKENCNQSSSAACMESKDLSSEEMQHIIDDLERENALMLKQMEYQDQINHEMQDLDIQRNEFKNALMDLLGYEKMVYVKQLERDKALLEYLEIAQEAENLADMFDAKLQRYQKYNDLMSSASEFFQYARDLEDVESYIEYARNDLSDYLTAIEYLTVRPFVELRRSIYTARGTNDFEMLYENLNDLTKKCGSGEESENKVTISLRNRMGFPETSYNDLKSEEKMMLSINSSNLPADAKIRYASIGDLTKSLANGSAFSGTFALTPTFANISNSCNAKIKEIQVRFVSMEGKTIRESADTTPYITLIYGGQSQLLSCHAQIEAITKSVGCRTSFGKYSTFNSEPFADGINAGVYEVPEGTSYKISDSTVFTGVTKYMGLKSYPLMASYTVAIDPEKGENKYINWNNIADIELQITYTTGTLGQESSDCAYDI